MLFISSNSDDFEKVDLYSKLVFDGFKLSGIVFDNYYVLDKITFKQADDYVSKSDLIFLSDIFRMSFLKI